jgi:hypothetical protein
VQRVGAGHTQGLRYKPMGHGLRAVGRVVANRF